MSRNGKSVDEFPAKEDRIKLNFYARASQFTGLRLKQHRANLYLHNTKKYQIRITSYTFPV